MTTTKRRLCQNYQKIMQTHHKRKTNPSQKPQKAKKKSQENPPKMMAKIYNVKEQIQNHFKGSD